MFSFTKSVLFTSIVAIAAQATTTVSSPTQTSLPALASQVPSCVAGCLGTIHESVGCDAGDIVCLCKQKASLISKVGLCIVGAQCDFEDVTGRFFYYTKPYVSNPILTFLKRLYRYCPRHVRFGS
jgi:hypothetical protein